jgi:serine/threonine protein kinase
LAKNPHERLTAADALCHPWFGDEAQISESYLEIGDNLEEYDDLVNAATKT